MQRADTYHQVVQHSGPCPADPEEVAELYVMDRLPADQVSAYEEHYIECAACATVLQDAAVYVTAMRAAAEELALKTPCRAAAGGAGPGSS
jgi:hypothetical protein